MSKTMKKLICALLSSTMLLSSVGLVGFASEEAPAATEAPAADAAATEAPADADATATEAPADAADATEAPAEGADTTQTAPGPAVNVDNSAYDNDDYYRRALDMATGLGIITGYEDGSVQPGSPVTRAEMASIILRMLGISASGAYRGAYTDVAEGHWAAKQIQAATDQGIINGMGDGTFMPDGSVTYEQVCVMLVRALNYGDEALQYGGWPNGYLNIASGVLDITDNADGEVGVAAERGLVIKMVYNALIGPYKEQRGFAALGQPEYSTSKTLAEARFDVKKGKGVLKATATTSIINSKLLTNQVLIDVEDDYNDDDEGTLFETALTNIDDYVGSNITYYYQDKATAAETVLTVFSTGSKTKTEELDVEDIEALHGFDDADDEDPYIEMYGASDKRFEADVEPTIVYNGQTITNEDLDNLSEDDARKWVYKYNEDGSIKYLVDTDENGNPLDDGNGNPIYVVDESGNKVPDRKLASMNDLLKPKMGSVKLIDTNSNGKYETIVVEKYEQMVVSAATASSVSGKINGISTRLKKLDDSDKVVTVTREGDTVRVRNLKTNDVASLKRDLKEEVIDIVVTAESFDGKIGSRGPMKDDEDVLITINGTKYPVDINALADVSTGKDCVFYTDSFGRIGYIEASSANGMLSTGEAYGWLMTAYPSEDGEEYMVKLMTTEGAVDYPLAQKVDMWLPGETSNETVSDDFETLFRGEDGETGGIIGDNTKTTDNSKFLKAGSYQIRAVKFKTNSSGEITKLYFAVDSRNVSDEDAMRVLPTDLTGVASMGVSVSGYTIPDGILEMNVPGTRSDITTASNYSFGTVTSSAYVVRENGSTRHYAIGEFEDAVTPSILINFATSATAPAHFEPDMDSAGGGPSAMIVDSIDEGYDDDDEVMYTVNGYLSGSEASVKTNKNTSVGWFKSVLWGGTSNRYFQADYLWTAGTPDSTTGLDMPEKLPNDALEEGDLILYSGDGKLIGKYVDASELADYDRSRDADTAFTTNHNPLGDESYNSTSRVHYIFGRLTDVDAESAWVQMVDDKGTALPTVVFDAAKTIDIIEISGSRATINPEGPGSAADLQTGDYVWVSTANKGDINSIVCYRITD